MIYTDPRSMFQKRIQALMKNEPAEIETLFDKLFALQQISLMERGTTESKSNWESLLNIYSILGINNYIKLISQLKGKTITFPTEEDVKDSVLTVLCFYYKEIEKKSWKEIIKLINVPNLNTIKYGIRIRQLSEFIEMKGIKR